LASKQEEAREQAGREQEIDDLRAEIESFKRNREDGEE